MDSIDSNRSVACIAVDNERCSVLPADSSMIRSVLTSSNGLHRERVTRRRSDDRTEGWRAVRTSFRKALAWSWRESTNCN